MSRGGREALPHDREWSGGPPSCSGVVGRPFRLFLSGRRPSQMSGIGRVALSDVQEALPDVREWSGGPP